MTYEERRKFRKTKEWKEWKAKCRLHTSRDYITGKPLTKDWNLHHLDLDVTRYNRLDDMNKFMPLNSKTHEIIHELYKWYKADHTVIIRIKEVLDKMEEFTNNIN